MNFSAFPAYTKFDPAVPVCCVTPGHGRTIHRFFDTSPISPDGRYLAATVLPYENHPQNPSDTAGILLVDLETGEERVIAETRGWGIQVGANVQWSDANTLVYNDADSDWNPHLVKHDIRTGEKKCMGKGVFMLSPDGRYALTHNLARSRITQVGYGVMIPDALLTQNGSCPEDDGFFLTDLETGECRLHMPLARIVREGIERKKNFTDGGFYGFQCKWSPNGQRIMYVVRWLSADGAERRNQVFTSDADGGNIRLALHWKEWAKGGHHVNWHPDSTHITMNLCHNSDRMKFVMFAFDGSDLHPICEHVVGSGHPTVHDSGNYILTDSYRTDRFAYPDGTTPLRLIDLRTGEERELVRMMTKANELEGGDWRCDPHPAWSYDRRYVIFNGFDGGTRRVYAADMSGIIH